MTNNFQNQNVPQWGFAQPGFGYAQQQAPAPVMNSTLTVDEQEMLRKKKPQFTGKLSQDEYLRAICTHKDAKTGNISLTIDPETQMATCSICGEQFKLLELDESFTMDEIRNICYSFNDVVNSIKTMYGSIPAEVGRQIFMICGFIKKMPEMYKEAFEYFRKLGYGNGLQPNRFNSNQAVSMYYSLMNPTGMPINPSMYGPQTFNPAFNQNGQFAQVNQQQQYAQGWGQTQPQQQAVNGWGQAILPSQQGVMSTSGAANPMNGPVANYNAPVGGNAAGYVDPTIGEHTQVVNDKQTVKSPDVKNGFNG